MGEAQWIAIDRLAVLVEESLSACAGWTVPCPTIRLGSTSIAGENWYVEPEGLDPSMVRAIESLRRRFRVEIPGGMRAKSGPLRMALDWTRARRTETV